MLCDVSSKRIVITCKYNKDIIEIFKKAPKRFYNAKTKQWIFPYIPENIEYLKKHFPSLDLELPDVEQINYIWSKVNNPELLEEIRSKLGYKTVIWNRNNFGFTREEKWVSCVSKKGWFLSGFISEIPKRFPNIKVRRLKFSPKLKNPNLPGIEFREYQLDAIERAIRCKRGIIHCPTGSGKTVIASGIISTFKHPFALFIVHTKALLNQTIATFKKFFPEATIGKIGDGSIKLGDITVGMIQTLSRFSKEELYELGSSTKIIIVDEAHHSHASSYQKVLSKLNVPFRIGLTATPHKLWTKEEYMKVTGILGPIIYKGSYKELAEKGYLAMPEVYIYNCICNTSGEGWHSSYSEGIISNYNRNKKIVDIANKLSKKGTVLIQINKVEHGKAILSIAKKKDVEIYFVHGGTEQSQQNKIKKALQDKNIKIVMCTTVWKEGVDVPSLDAVIFAAGGKSDISTIQAVGRALRPSKTNKAIIVDFYDRGDEYLENHSERRIDIYKAHDWKINFMD